MPADQPPREGGTDVVDCFFNPDGEADFSSVKEAHSALVDQVVEVDEALMEKYLEQARSRPSSSTLPSKKALREGHLIRCASLRPGTARA